MASIFTRIIFASVLLLTAPSTLAAGLSPTEQAIVAHVDEHASAAFSLLERTVNINSGSMNFAGVREVGRVFGGEFTDLGFRTRWEDGAAFGRAGHLVAEFGARGIHLLLIGHLDTVFEPDSPFQRYEAISPSLARGPGTTDMKGGNVIILEALKALKAVGSIENMQITVILIGDEESSGRPLKAARAELIKAATAADVALGFEDGDGDPHTAVIARRGYSGWRLQVTGRPAHSSQIFSPSVGHGAIFETARVLTSFRETLEGEPYLTFNPGVVLGGTSVDFDEGRSRGSAFGKANVIAESTVVTGDLRTLSVEQRESAITRMQAIVARQLPGTHSLLTFTEGYPPLAPTDGNKVLLALYDRASQDLGFGAVTAVDPAAAGAADISFTAGLVDMALDGLGLMGSGGHTVNETADLDTLPSQTKRAALLMHRLSLNF
ncbi:MAG: M20/M25/M40 family metallo-hydrolase [Gammaproteobacteria bacterium]|nr:M20/M25/M40 family metallo-hydrolase [Gammaproteobacteria bacterium]